MNRTLHQLLQPLADMAPDWARWFCVDYYGNTWLQSERGSPSGGVFWNPAKVWECLPFIFDRHDMFAIDLTTGSIHLPQPDGSIIEVTQEEWSAET